MELKASRILWEGYTGDIKSQKVMAVQYSCMVMVHDEAERVALRGSLSIDGEKDGEKHLLAFSLQSCAYR